MLHSTDRILYVGTEDGLYLAEPDGKEYKSRPLALQGKGVLRSPVQIDRDNPRRIYAATSRQCSRPLERPVFSRLMEDAGLAYSIKYPFSVSFQSLD